MKKIVSIFFILALLAAVATVSPLAAIVGVGALFFAVNKYSSNYAMLTLVPAVMRDPSTGEEIPPMTRAEKALYDYLTKGKANSITYEAILSGAVSFDPISYYMRADITGLSGRQTIVGPSTNYALGVTNFPNQAVLQQYYNFCFDRIAVRYIVVAAADATPQSSAGYSSVATSMAAGLRNGELIVLSNRNTIVETPISDFVSAAAVTGGGVREFDGGILEKPRFFLEQLQIQVDLNLADTIPSAANNTYLVEVVFSGVQARMKY